MTTPGDSFALAKAALHAQITAATVAQPGVVVSYGSAGTGKTGDMIEILDGAGDEFVSPTSDRREEEYSIQIRARSYTGDDNQRFVTERVIELKGLVESAVAVDPRLGGAVSVAYVKGRRAVTERRSGGGREAEATFDVRCVNYHDELG